jgi:protease-4
VFTGHQAIDVKLIDELGDEKTALAWLAKEKNVDTKLPVRDYQLKSRFGDLPFLHAAALAVFDAAGFSALGGRLEELGAVAAIERFNLDGLLALWHPATAN